MSKDSFQERLQELVGQELHEDFLPLVQLFHTFSSLGTYQGVTIDRSLLVPRPNRCEDAGLLDVAGMWNTGPDGKVTFRLSQFLCPVPPGVSGEPFMNPVNVVATPLSRAPLFLAVRRALVDNGFDVEIEVATWDSNGVVAPNVAFDWRCRVKAGYYVL